MDGFIDMCASAQELCLLPSNELEYTKPGKIEIKKGALTLRDEGIDGFLERTVTPIGTSGKADVPGRYLGRRVYVIITKNVVEGKDVKQ